MARPNSVFGLSKRVLKDRWAKLSSTKKWLILMVGALTLAAAAWSASSCMGGCHADSGCPYSQGSSPCSR